ncbi:uncharacterized protein I206_101548 [Kwoniella pini CBS 10737]|uniref:Uncharacterized protein n=1 Tax=Kwoniella pini CBS 10737 TaxID=1296096 RepID=A0AAJ8L1G5_9TREE
MAASVLRKKALNETQVYARSLTAPPGWSTNLSNSPISTPLDLTYATATSQDYVFGPGVPVVSANLAVASFGMTGVDGDYTVHGALHPAGC